MSNDLNFVKAEELVTLLGQQKSRDRKEKIVVVDNRTVEEFTQSGHIKGAVNLPSTQWDASFVDELVKEHVSSVGDGKKLVVHCAHSKQRGTTCARLLQEGLDRYTASLADAETPALPAV